MTSYESLSGRTALVTGAASGIGAATARLLARSGARVALLSRRPDRLAALAAETGGLAVPADVTDAAAVDAAVAVARESLGRLDLVVNAAGVMLPNPVPAGRRDEWRRMVDTNVTGVLNIVAATTPGLVATAAAGAAADLVNISSIGASVVFAGYAVYGATKAMVSQLSTALRADLGPLGVRVTNVEPGLTDTELGGHIDNAGATADLAAMFAAIGPLAAEEVADVVGYAVSRPRHVNLRQLVVLPTGQV